MKNTSTFYAFLKRIIYLVLHLSYRKISIEGLENVPDKPLLIAANHQNALIDPILIATHIGQNPYFLARSDIFKRPWLKRFFYGLKMRPVYRMRDGINQLQKNEAIFSECAGLLKAGESIIIFPEGNHHFQRRLRALKKGFSRIAFMAISEMNELDIQIIPIGINYEDSFHFNTSVSLRFGRPLSIRSYFELYQKDSKKAQIAIREDLKVSMKKEMVHLSSSKNYQFGECLLRVAGGRKSTFAEIKNAERWVNDWIEQRNDDDLAALREKTDKIQSCSLHFFGARNFFINTYRTHNFFELIVLIPGLVIWLYGLMNNLLAKSLPGFVARRYFKDRIFHASVRLVVGLVSFPLCYSFQSLLFYALSNNFGLTILYLLSLPITEKFSVALTPHYKSLWGRLHFSKKARSQWLEMNQLLQELEQIGQEDVLKTDDQHQV